MTELAKAWLDIYAMLEDNAFDYVGKPFYMDDDAIILRNDNGGFTTYYPAPF